jgi:hypothetical protein
MGVVAGAFVLALIGAVSGFVLKNVMNLSFNQRQTIALGVLAAPMAGGLMTLLGVPSAAPLAGGAATAALILGIERYRRRVL